MPLVSELQSWGQCSICETNLWVEQSPHEQRCICNCGSVSLHNATKNGTEWAAVSEADFQAIVDADIAVGMAP